MRGLLDVLLQIDSLLIAVKLVSRRISLLNHQLWLKPISVLLIESGPNSKSNFLRAPALVGISNSTKRFSSWYETTPQKHLNNRKLLQPRGRCVGGSSTANLMLYVRGNSGDYDRWANLIGHDRFKYDNVLPYFKKSQNAIKYGEGLIPLTKTL